MDLELISPEIVTEMLKRSYIVKMISFIDIIFSLLYFFLVPYIGIAGILSLIFAFIGYYGAKYLNKCKVLSYSMYLLFQNVVRFGIFIFIICNPSYFEYIDVTTQFIIMNSIFLFLNFYINYLVFSLYNLIKNYYQTSLNSIVVEPSGFVIMVDEV